MTSNPSNNEFDGTYYSATIALEDDEDGVVDDLRDLVLASGQTPSLSVEATNETSEDAVLAGWIDYNANGVFEKSERATATVPAGSRGESVTLVFPEVPEQWVYSTYARFRLSNDASFVVDPQPTGKVDSGEVEDYLVGRTTRIWDGEAGDNDLNNAANWATLLHSGEVINNNAIPSLRDNAVIPEAFADQTLVLDSLRGCCTLFEIGAIQKRCTNTNLRHRGADYRW